MLELPVRAHHLATRIRPQDADSRPTFTARKPVLTSVGAGAWLVVFPYGVAVTFGLRRGDEGAVLESLSHRLEEPAPVPETEEATVRVTGDADGVVDDAILLSDLAPARLLVVSEVLARSVVLAHLELRVGHAFDSMEPLAERLSAGRRPTSRERDLLGQIGTSLVTQIRTVGRVEVVEKPELLWDRPELEPLFNRLSAEYDLAERDRGLTRKLGVVSDLSATLFDLVQTRQMLRVEWYIVLLIVFEILLTFWQMGRVGG